MTHENLDGRNGQLLSPYRKWQQSQGIPVYEGSYVSDLYHAPVASWPMMGQSGAFVNLADQEHDDSWLVEIAPGGETTVQHHLFESLVYVLDGQGATTIWQGNSDQKQTVEWKRGSLFSPPLNCYYQHFNLDGQQPARLVCVTHAPTMINQVGGAVNSVDFIFNNPYVFSERFGGEQDFFSNPGYRIAPRIEWKTNYIADVRQFQLDDKPERGEGSSNMHLHLANNAKLMAHISEWLPGTYLKGHRHGVGAHVLILNGTGYSLLWFEGEERKKVDWQDGAVLSPREWEYHQHFASGPEPVRYLAFRFRGFYSSGRSQNTPDQIESEGEDPAIYDQFEQECLKNGVQPRYLRPSYARR
jgi:predicted metal-dependent enzyme (double-stranded beta helix superfamily)